MQMTRDKRATIRFGRFSLPLPSSIHGRRVLGVGLLAGGGRRISSITRLLDGSPRTDYSLDRQQKGASAAQAFRDLVGAEKEGAAKWPKWAQFLVEPKL